MNLTDDFVLKCQAGEPVFLEDICAIFPATLREIAALGYEKFQQYLGIIIAERPAFEKKTPTTELLESLTDFQYLLAITTLDGETNQLARAAFKFFTHEDVFFSSETAQIIIGPLTEKHIIDEEQFYAFRKIIKRMYWLGESEEDIIILENDTEQVKNLKKQMIKNRQKLAKAKAKKARQEQSSEALSFSDLIGSLCINNCGVNMINVWDLTYYAFHDQLRRMGWRDKFDINNRAALAGAKISKKELKHWIKPIIND